MTYVAVAILAFIAGWIVRTRLSAAVRSLDDDPRPYGDFPSVPHEARK